MAWEQLLSILKADAQERAFWNAQPPRACPADGTPLETGPNGELFCRHDGFQYPRDWQAPTG
jgi:hypothetical protein